MKVATIAWPEKTPCKKLAKLLSDKKKVFDLANSYFIIIDSHDSTIILYNDKCPKSYCGALQ